jgi:DnaK suppressor protein
LPGNEELLSKPTLKSQQAHNACEAKLSETLSISQPGSKDLDMENDRLEFFRNLLHERLTHLLEEAGATLGDLTDDKENLADALDIATMESNRDFQLRIRDRERVYIRKIQEALLQINEGEYGYCIACGEEISEARLIARPVASHCIDCKTEAEQLERRSRSL